LLGDGTRVLTRTMKKIDAKSGGLKGKVRDRMRSVRKRVLAIALSTRLMGPPGERKRKQQYRELLRRAAARLEFAAKFRSGASTEARTNPGVGSRRCRLLFLQARESVASPGSAKDLGTQQK